MAKARDAEEEARQSFQVSANAHAAFKGMCASRAVGRTMYDAGTRLLQWFNRQSPIVQTAVMADVDEGMEAAYAAALRRLADELENKHRPKHGRIGNEHVQIGE